MVFCKYAAKLQENTQPAINIYENHTYMCMDVLLKFAACLQNTSEGLLLNIEKYPHTLEIYG